MKLALLYFLSEFDAGTVRIIEINRNTGLNIKYFLTIGFLQLELNKLHGRDN